MNINRWLGLGLGVVLLAGCEYFVAAPPLTPTTPATPIAASNSPTMSPSGSVSCSDVSIDATKQALRDVASYTYQATGYIEMWERFTGATGPLETPDTTIRRPTKSSGAYVAPDRLAQEYELVNARDDVLEARLQTGDEVWIRFVGSRRWVQRDGTEPAPANSILAIVDQPLDWAIGDSEDMPAHCTLVGTSADGPIAVTVKLTAPVGSDMPTSLEVTRQIDQPPDWERTVLQSDVYVVQPDAQVSIDPPAVDPGPATEADVLYHLERHGLCLEPPCDVRGFELVYQAHNGTVDLFGYELPSGNGYVWFDNGLATESGSSQVCPSEWDFSFHTSPGDPGDTQWLGGPLTAPETATLHVRLSDGQESEHAISAPAYIVPAGIVDGPQLESFWILGPDGDELFRYNAPSPETGVPPPPPPSPGC